MSAQIASNRKPFLAAAVQMTPVWMNKRECTAKVCGKITELGQKGVELAVFPEVIIPGTPHWNWFDPSNLDLFALLYDNSVALDDEEIQQICEASRLAGMHVIVGLTEKIGKALYNSLRFIDEAGRLLGIHRKLMPTHSEKVLWAAGDSSGLTVYPTRLGKLGGLICAEHNMSLARYALAQQGEEIHAAVWVSASARRLEFNRQVEIWCASYALANQTYVICAQACASDEEIERFQFPRKGGWSAILAPDASFVAGPLEEREGDVIAPIDLYQAAKMYPMYDSVGFNGRPDIFSFAVKRSPNHHD